MGVDHLDTGALERLGRRQARTERANPLVSAAIGQGGVRVHSGGVITIQNGGLSITGTASVIGSLLGSGAFTWSGPVTITGATGISGNLTISGALTVLSTAIAANAATIFALGLTASGAVSANGLMTANSTLTAAADVYMTGLPAKTGTGLLVGLLWRDPANGRLYRITS